MFALFLGLKEKTSPFSFPSFFFYFILFYVKTPTPSFSSFTELNLERYKFTVHAVIGEQRGQGVKFVLLFVCECLFACMCVCVCVCVCVFVCVCVSVFPLISLPRTFNAQSCISLPMGLGHR